MMIGSRGSTVMAALAIASSALSLAAQAPDAAGSRAVQRLPANAVVVPFSVGERLDYDVRFGSLKVGNGSMEVREIAPVRGRPAWHTVFAINGGVPLYVDEGSYERRRRYEIFPERGMFKENDRPEEPTVANPLDDGSFLYFVRTVPLEVGKSYEYARYFKAAGNPVRIRVVRRETITVPGGTFNTVVLQPTFQTKGIFSKNGKAEVWISDDDRRLMVQMKSKLSFGSLNLFLRSVSSAKPQPAP